MKRLLLTALICLSVMACSKQEEASSEEAADAATTATAETAASTATEADGAAASPAEVVTGIAACDEFLEAYKTCLAEKVPEGTREVMMQGMAQRKQSWLDMLKDEATKAQLPEVCARAKESTKTVLEMYGCET